VPAGAAADHFPATARVEGVPADGQGSDLHSPPGNGSYGKGPVSSPVPRAPMRFGDSPDRFQPVRQEPQLPGQIHDLPGRVPTSGAAAEGSPLAGELARRIPRAPRSADDEGPQVPQGTDGGDVVAPTKRSAAEVRSLLSRYRGGLDRGRTRRTDD
jgi:hypothetical protein